MEQQQFYDKTIECKQCHNEYILSEGEQAFFSERGLNMPSRCKNCRAQNKLLKEKGVAQPQAQTLPHVENAPKRRRGNGGGRRGVDDDFRD
jgi:hypothetical protein